MRILQSQLARRLAALVIAVMASLPALAQRPPGRPAKPPNRGVGHAPAPKPEMTGAEKKQTKEDREARRLQGLSPKWMENLQEMSPDQQERFLSNNERFRNLPADRQAQIRRQLQQWNNLTPQQRQNYRERAKVWEQMTPEQRQHVTQEILPKWKQLPQDRRQAILQHLHALHGLSESDRAAKLNDPAFTSDLNPEDRQMLRELSNLRVGNTPEPPQENP